MELLSSFLPIVIFLLQTTGKQLYELNFDIFFTGTKPGSHQCVLKNEDASEKHFLKIETTPVVSSCSPQQQHPKHQVDGAELHIINIPENAIIR